MKVLVADILSKIPDLPADFRDHVTIDPADKSLAYVRSFTTDDVYTVHIKPHAEDTGDKTILQTTCPCDARTLCKHVVAFYAVAYNLGPTVEHEKPSDASESKPEEEVDQVPVETDADVLTRLQLNVINAQASLYGEVRRQLAECRERYAELARKIEEG